jgi:hypothetical protein
MEQSLTLLCPGFTCMPFAPSLIPKPGQKLDYYSSFGGEFTVPVPIIYCHLGVDMEELPPLRAKPILKNYNTSIKNSPTSIVLHKKPDKLSHLREKKCNHAYILLTNLHIPRQCFIGAQD